MSEEQPVEGHDPAPEPLAGSDAPWANDLAQFTDPQVRAQVDGLLRGRQGYATRLEQQYAETADARRLYEDLQTNPHEVIAALAQETGWQPEYEEPEYGYDEQFDPEQQYAQYEEPQGLDPRVQALLDRQEEADNMQAYEGGMAAMVDQPPDIEPELFHPFVAAADSWEEAYDMYANFA